MSIIHLEDYEPIKILGKGNYGIAIEVKDKNGEKLVIKITCETDNESKIHQEISDVIKSTKSLNNYIRLVDSGILNEDEIRDWLPFSLKTSEDYRNFLEDCEGNLEENENYLNVIVMEKIDDTYMKNGVIVAELDEYSLFEIYLGIYELMSNGFEPFDLHLGNIGYKCENRRLVYKIENCVIIIPANHCRIKFIDYGFYGRRKIGITHYSILRKMIQVLQFMTPKTKLAEFLREKMRNKKCYHYQAFDMLSVFSMFIGCSNKNINIRSSITSDIDDLLIIKRDTKKIDQNEYKSDIHPNYFNDTSYERLVNDYKSFGAIKVPKSYLEEYVKTKPIFDTMFGNLLGKSYNLTESYYIPVIEIGYDWSKLSEEEKKKYE